MRQYFFAALLIACSGGSSAQAILVDANGTGIGTFLERLEVTGDSGQSFPSAGADIARYDYHLLTTRGYRFVLAYFPLEPIAYVRGYWNQGEQNVFFESSDCTGQGYTEASYGGFVGNIKIDQNLETNGVAPQMWYAPKSQQPIIRSPLSRVIPNQEGTLCQSFVGSDRYAVEVFPNDPLITGIAEATFDLPLDFENALDQRVQDCIFRDSFECLLR